MINIKNHHFTKEEIKDINVGKTIEMEHTNNPKIAERIAKQHEIEFSGYYNKGLIPMERRLKNA
jgi:hypothetical protein